MHGLHVYDSGRTSRGSDVQALPAPLLASPLGYARATGTVSTSAVAVDECRTGGTSGQSTFNDHAGEAELPTSDRQTHPVSYLGVNLITGALLCLHRPRRSELVPRHERRV
jgi:hypothetical protein